MGMFDFGKPWKGRTRITSWEIQWSTDRVNSLPTESLQNVNQTHAELHDKTFKFRFESVDFFPPFFFFNREQIHSIHSKPIETTINLHIYSIQYIFVSDLIIDLIR